jgi:tetratricopeptide (TPR) repeat protein
MKFWRVSTFLAAAGGCLCAQTLAVLPFANITAPASAAPFDWIGESIAETVRDAVGVRGGLTIARTDVDEAFRRLNLRPISLLTQASVLKVGAALEVEQMAYGTFQFIPDTTAPAGTRRGALKIAARVIDRGKLARSSDLSESGNLEDLPTLEAHLAWRVLMIVAPRLAPPEADFRTLRPNIRLDAQESYIRGLIAREPEQRERFLLQATRIEPKFGHPAFELGRIHYDRKEYRQAVQWLQKIAPDDVHAHDASFLLGLAFYQAGDYAGAQKAFQSLAAVVPLSEVLNNLGAAQNRRRIPEAVESFARASQGDPNDPTYYFNLGYAQWQKGDFPSAAVAFRSELERQPDDQLATLLLGLCIKRQGPRQGDAQLESLERLKTNYEERAYLQLKALVGSTRSNGPSDPPK